MSSEIERKRRGNELSVEDKQGRGEAAVEEIEEEEVEGEEGEEVQR